MPKTVAQGHTAKTSTRRPRPVLFHAYASRVRFLVLTTSLVIALVSAYAIIVQWRVHHDDAARADDRHAATSLAEVSALVENAYHAVVDLGASALGAGADQCPNLVAAAAPRLAFAADFGLADPSGNIICASQPWTDRPSLAGTAAFNRALATKAFAVNSAPAAGEDRLLTFDYPVRDRQGRLLAVAFADISLEAVAAALHPAIGYVSGVADARGQSFVRLTAAAAAPTVVWSEPPPRLVTEMLSRKSGVAVVTDTDGAHRRYTFTAAPNFGSARLYYYVGSPTETIYAAADRTALIVALLIAAAFSLITALMLALGNFLIARQTRRVVSAMRHVVAGELNPDLIPRGLSELDGIVSLFTDLAAKFRQTRTDVEEEVKQRTSSLNVSKGLVELEKARLEALISSIGEGVVSIDGEGQVLFLNGVAHDALWWKAPHAEGTDLIQAFRLEDAKENPLHRDFWPVWEAMRDRKIVRTPAPAKPFYLRRKDRSRFPVQITASPIIIGGEVVGALAVLADITSEVEFDRRKSEFISVASHQLRSPSSAIKFMADMLRKGDFGALTDKQKEWADKLYVTTDAMIDLINELLNISRVEAGVRMEPKETDTAGFLDGVVKQVESMIMEKKQKLVYRPVPLPRLVFDSFALGEVVKNLISNASKYSAEGSTITLEVAPAATEVRFSITDQGIGIPRSSYDQMFNKFFRAENALKSPVTGTGLGLYYCKSVVDLHQGRIGFDSTEGKGTTFWFTLPLGGPAKKAGAAAPPPAAEPPKEAA